MAEFKFDYKIISPQLYEDDGRKLSKDTSKGNLTVTADNSNDAKKIARNKIKQGNTYKTMVSNLPSQDTSFEKKPRITLQDTKTYLKKLAKKLKSSLKSGPAGSQRSDEVIKRIVPPMHLKGDPYWWKKKKLKSGGRVDKALPGGSKYI